eukprot:gene8142-10044_t
MEYIMQDQRQRLSTLLMLTVSKYFVVHKEHFSVKTLLLVLSTSQQEPQALHREQLLKQVM